MNQHPNWGKGRRGPTKYHYTYDDIAKITGLKRSYLKKLNHLGKFNIKDIHSVVKFILGRMIKCG